MNQGEIRPGDQPPLAFVAWGGEMGRLIRAFDWSKTPVGPAAAWPQSLKVAVRIMTDSRYAMWLGWGPEFTFFYNDAYARMTLGPKHPWALGRSAREVWPEIWDDIGPRAESVVRTGQATWDEGLLLFLERQGFPEETYHTFSYSPIPDDRGSIGGMLCVVAEDTERTIGERRLRMLRELAARTTEGAKSVEDACQTAVRTLTENSHDLPFILIYLLEEDAKSAMLAGATGLPDGSPAAPPKVDLVMSLKHDGCWPLRAVLESGRAQIVTGLGERFGPLRCGPWPEPVERAIVVPMAKPGQLRPAGFMVAGVSPRLELSDAYKGFLELIASHVATAVGNARAYQEERRRVEQLAELDRAKTAFFSNVSHEFRTPLTLMLGPVEDLLARSHTDLPPAAAGQLELVNRNGLRLLRLVNSLLDFSRIEAGRVRALFQPTDLSTFTADLASNFRSACERAGLRLAVDCPPLGERVFVDRDMWEKVVLNLVSNAFKFTFEGEIAVSLRRAGTAAVLRVKDTGTGIPGEEIPRLFERFHRIERARGRTHEGSGIGLALVQELVKLHGGSVAVESIVGAGTTFTVTVPLGSAHLPLDQIGNDRAAASTGTGATPYVEEALRWLPDEWRDEGRRELPSYREALPTPHRRLDPDGEDDRPRVLVADDNADMRQYIVRLLAEQFRVEAVPDGEAALAAARDRLPDLILTDVMMPKLNGFGLLKELRADPRTCGLPVIMLSARAGEESRVEGMEAGADDYLVKPFSARELLARVTAHLQMARLRREADRRWRDLAEALPNLVWTALPDGRGDYFSSQCTAFTGVSEAELLGDAWLERVIHPDDRLRTLACWKAAVEEKGIYDIAYRLRRHDGAYHWFKTRGVPVRDDSGRIVRWFGTCTDIEDLKRAEEQLRASEERFRTLFESMDEGFCVIEMLYDADNRPADYRFLEANPTFEKHTGLKDAVGRTIRELVPNHDSHWYEIYGRVAATGEATRFVNQTKAIGRWFDVYAYRVGGPDSRRIGIIFTDITARKRDEEKNLELLRELETQHAFVKAVISQVPAAIVVADAATGQIRMSNEEAHRIVRHDYHEGKRLEDYGNTYVREAFATDGSRYSTGRWPLDRALCGETVLAEEIELVLSDGARVSVRVNAGPIRVGEKVVAAVVAFHDITDRKLEEQAARFLADASAALSGLVDYADTLQRVAKLAVPGFADWAVVDMAEEPGSTRRLVVGHADPAKADLALALQRRFSHGAANGPIDMLRTGRAKLQTNITDEMLAAAAQDEADLRLLRELGPKSSIGVPLTVQGEPVGVLTFLVTRSGRQYGDRDLAVANDLASRASIAIENSQLYARLKDADRRKDEFLATLAHELRNPLAPIRNGLQLMRLAGRDTAMVEKTRTMIERQMGQMVRLVDDLMDISRINQGKLELRKERVDLAAVLTSAVETSRPLIESMSHSFDLVLPGQPVAIDGDLTRLAQVFSNLLTNAAKYSERGGRITLIAQRHEDEVTVSVRDTGIGIAADQLPRIFEMFSQVSTALERSQGGLGIGLTLVRRLVEMHGGSVEARSEGLGRGSEFVVRLPIAIEASEPQRRPDEPAVPKSSLRILIVDDNRDGADSLAMMLQIMGNEIATAYDGQEGVTAAERVRPDVVLLDIGLPKLNGYEAARRIRQQPWSKYPVLIAVTGWGQDEDRRRSREAGFDHHLVKPVDPNVLMELLAGLNGAKA